MSDEQSQPESQPDEIAGDAAATDAGQSALTAEEFAREAARIAHENRAEDVAIIDLRGISSVADFFVIGTGTSDRQMHAALDQVRDFARGAGRKPYRVADSTSSAWILADFVDVVVHLFDQMHRDYYDLEGLWGDAPRLDWPPQADDEDRADD